MLGNLLLSGKNKFYLSTRQGLEQIIFIRVLSKDYNKKEILMNRDNDRIEPSNPFDKGKSCFTIAEVVQAHDYIDSMKSFFYNK